MPRLLLIMQDSTPSPLKVHIAHALGSLAKGSDHHRKELIDHGVFPVLISILARPETCASPKLVEACLGCIRSVASHPEAPIDMIYSDESFVPHLISLMAGPSPVNQIAIATIFACACKVFFHFSRLEDEHFAKIIPLLQSDGQAAKHVGRGERHPDAEPTPVHAKRERAVAGAAVPFVPRFQQRGRRTASLALHLQRAPPDRGHRRPH